MAKMIQLLCNDEPHLQHHIPAAHVITYARNASSVDVTSIPASHRGEIDYLVMSGSHGNFIGTKPTQLNGLGVDAAQELLAKLMSLSISAWTIVLDCCFSAGFVPDYRSLLVTGRTKPGTILCHYGSASGTMTSELGSSMYTVQRAAKGQFGSLGEMTDFVSLGIYVDGKTAKKLYVKSVANLDQASSDYVGLISGGSSEAADVRGLMNYLKTQGIEVHAESKEVVANVMSNAIIV
ncbi:MAG: hypothetical protein R3F55_23285 [Alphaproteobacteria bacterium]